MDVLGVGRLANYLAVGVSQSARLTRCSSGRTIRVRRARMGAKLLMGSPPRSLLRMRPRPRAGASRGGGIFAGDGAPRRGHGVRRQPSSPVAPSERDALFSGTARARRPCDGAAGRLGERVGGGRTSAARY